MLFRSAYYLKEDLRQIWSQPNKRTARRVLRDWMARARASGIRMLKRARTQKGVLADASRDTVGSTSNA